MSLYLKIASSFRRIAKTLPGERPFMEPAECEADLTD
jgi:hypothetical protein